MRVDEQKSRLTDIKPTPTEEYEVFGTRLLFEQQVMCSVKGFNHVNYLDLLQSNANLPSSR